VQILHFTFHCTLHFFVHLLRYGLPAGGGLSLFFSCERVFTDVFLQYPMYSFCSISSVKTEIFRIFSWILNLYRFITLHGECVFFLSNYFFSLFF